MINQEVRPTIPLPGLPNGARLILAPLCGITTSVFRRICFEHGAEMAVSEMISSEALARGNHRNVRAIKGIDVTAGPLSLQIVGADPEKMGDTAARLSEFGPEYIDINLGCPVRKIVRKNGGSAVLKDLDLLGRICRRVVQGSSVPVSAKIRAGWGKPSGKKIRDIALAIEDAGISMLAVHARTRGQDYNDSADWDLISVAKGAVSIPVVGNGDVKSADDVVNMGKATACDAVMMGRAAIGNPWIFEEARAGLDGGDYIPPSLHERMRVLLEHARESVEVNGEPLGIINMRNIMSCYVKRLPDARRLRARLMRALRLRDLEELLEVYLAENNARRFPRRGKKELVIG